MMQKIMKEKQSITIVRYKKDLRVADHKPLSEACQWNFPVVAIYLREPHIMQADDYSHFHQYRIQESLKDLNQSLKQLNIPLLMRHWEFAEALDMIQRYYTIKNIFAHEETGNNLSYMRDLSMIEYCKMHTISFVEYPSNGVVRRLLSRDHRSMIQKDRMSVPTVSIPQIQHHFILQPELIRESKKSFINFLPATKPSTWIYQQDLPGETQAYIRLSYFLNHAWWYRYALSRPELSVKDSSRLSAYLTYGNLSMKQVHQAFLTKIKELKLLPKEDKYSARAASGLLACYQRLFWRCHFVQKLESQPSIEFYNQNKAFDTIRNEINNNLIQARYHGQTGIPMIDAGMRCLQATGWINFRMRATLVSFICNSCLQPWQAIHPLLARIFVDYEPGIHLSQLQMQAGTTGINTIRIYNPIKQLAEKDSDLNFVRRWVPEITSLSNEEIYALGTQEGSMLLELKRTNYNKPIIDVVEANKQARIVLRWVRKTDESKTEAKKVFAKLGSRKSPTKRTSKKVTTNQMQWMQQGSLFE
jgi:deoxyribodipyrimidine photo-lyase